MYCRAVDRVRIIQLTRHCIQRRQFACAPEQGRIQRRYDGKRAQYQRGKGDKPGVFVAH